MNQIYTDEPILKQNTDHRHRKRYGIGGGGRGEGGEEEEEREGPEGQIQNPGYTGWINDNFTVATGNYIQDKP